MELLFAAFSIFLLIRGLLNAYANIVAHTTFPSVSHLVSPWSLVKAIASEVGAASLALLATGDYILWAPVMVVAVVLYVITVKGRNLRLLTDAEQVQVDKAMAEFKRQEAR